MVVTDLINFEISIEAFHTNGMDLKLFKLKQLIENLAINQN